MPRRRATAEQVKATKPRPGKSTKKAAAVVPAVASELVILTGLSGSGKASALKAFEDLGFYAVDNMPLELIPAFADLVRQSAEINRAALVVDVREGQHLDRFPAILRQVRKVLSTTVVFLDASDAFFAAAIFRNPPSPSAGSNGNRRARDSCREKAA